MASHSPLVPSSSPLEAYGDLSSPNSPVWLNMASLASCRGFWDPPGFASTEM